jgi:hypothetical protein
LVSFAHAPEHQDQHLHSERREAPTLKIRLQRPEGFVNDELLPSREAQERYAPVLLKMDISIYQQLARKVINSYHTGKEHLRPCIGFIKKLVIKKITIFLDGGSIIKSCTTTRIPNCRTHGELRTRPIVSAIR